MSQQYTVDDLVFKDGRRPFKDRLESDFDYSIQSRILKQVGRFEFGNFGHCKPLGQGIFETKCTFGGGVRIYFGLEGSTLVLLVLCGNKGTQDKDISQAKALWLDFREEKDHG